MSTPVILIYLADGSGFCKCGNHATLDVKAWDVKLNKDVLKGNHCAVCFLAWQTALLLKAKGKAA